MNRVSIFFFLTLATILVTKPTYADVTSNSDVTATVPSSSFYGPNLISPPDNHATNSARTTFIWKRPSPLPDASALDHYDLFIDNTIFASNIPDSLTSQDFYFYTATGSSGYFYLGLKQDQSQGYHTWRVAVYDNLGQNTATGNWTYYIDSISPFISLSKIHNNNYTWNTSVSGSIPDETNRHLTTTTKSPKLTGKVETNANFQFSLLCPSSAPSSCTSQTWITNSTDGNWEQQLTNLTSNIEYSVLLSATDATNNSTIFPTFYLKYSTSTATSPTTTPTSNPTVSISPTATITQPSNPTLTPLPTISAKLTPPPGLSALVAPTPFTSKTPPAPTLPPARQQAAVVIESNALKILLVILLILGLPIHLLSSSYSLGIKVSLFPKFLFVFGFPFLRSSNSQTTPFTQISLYDSTKPLKMVFETLSDINGQYRLPADLPNQILVKLKSQGKDWKDQVVTKNQIISSCLYPYQKKFKTQSDQLKSFTYNNLRVIPLIVAIVSSGLALIYLRNIYTISYFYLSVQYLYSEYFYYHK